MVNSLKLMDTDLASMKQNGVYRAQMVERMAVPLGATLDGELFNLYLAAGQKDKVVEMEIPKRYDFKKDDLYFDIADLVSECSQSRDRKEN